MFCNNCGSEINEDFQYCINCGTKIQLEQLVNKNNAPRKKRKINKIILLLVLIFVVIASIVVALILFFSRNKIEGRYNYFYSGDNYIEFNVGKTDLYDGTFIYYNTGAGGKFPGVWRLDGNKLIKKYDMFSDDYFDTLDIYKNYLIDAEYTYIGNIPSGEKFDTTCKYKDSSYVFKSDGTGTRNYLDSYNKKQSSKFTYVRDGEIITLTLADTNKTAKLLIYNGGVNASVYVKQKN